MDLLTKACVFITNSTDLKYCINSVMARITWKILKYVRWILKSIEFHFRLLKIAFLSLFHNDFADWYYIGDTLMEPMFWFVDHFTKILGPICVTGVIILGSSVIAISYIIGLPFYIRWNSYLLGVALVIGHWLLMNCIFYYYMAYTTEPGYPPQHNEIAPVMIDFYKNVAKHILIKTYILQQPQFHFHNITSSTEEVKNWSETLYHSCVIYTSLLCMAVFFVLGGLTAWHARLISNGETSIESHINKKERARFKKENKVYKNPYDFGPVKNWKIFLCVGDTRPWWHILFPFADHPPGDGLQWNFYNQTETNHHRDMKDIFKTCSVKIS